MHECTAWALPLDAFLSVLYCGTKPWSLTNEHPALHYSCVSSYWFPLSHHVSLFWVEEKLLRRRKSKLFEGFHLRNYFLLMNFPQPWSWRLSLQHFVSVAEFCVFLKSSSSFIHSEAANEKKLKWRKVQPSHSLQFAASDSGFWLVVADQCGWARKNNMMGQNSSKCPQTNEHLYF